MPLEHSRIRDLPEKERKPFADWLVGQTCPVLEGLPQKEQDAYYAVDYIAWKRRHAPLD